MSDQPGQATTTVTRRIGLESCSHELIDLVLVVLATALTFIAAALEPQIAGLLVCACAVGSAPLRRGTWYLDPVLAFALPWLVVLLTTLVGLSAFSRPVADATFLLIAHAVLAWWFAVSVASMLSAVVSSSTDHRKLDLRLPMVLRPQVLPVTLLLVALIVLTVVQVSASGFIPLLEGLRGRATRYLDFGIPTVYGLYLALANVVAMAAIYRFAATRRSRHLFPLALVLLVFTLFVTRQNVLTVALAGLAIWTLIRGRLSTTLVVVAGVVALLAFAAFGEFRSGDIRRVAGIPADGPPVPAALVWVYSYGYFTVLNLDNVIERGGGPHFDGSSVASLVPTVLRQATAHPRLLERPQFTVRSYLADLHLDLGTVGAVLFTMAVAFLTGLVYHAALHRRTFRSAGAYGVLYVCALFAFFTNFWFYLPVVSQWVLVWLLGPLFEVPRRLQGAVVQKPRRMLRCGLMDLGKRL